MEARMNLAILFVLLFFTQQYGTPLMPGELVERYNLDEFICHFRWMDGWMTCDFTSFSTVIQSYQDYGRMTIKECWLLNTFTVERIFAYSGSRAGDRYISWPALNPGVWLFKTCLLLFLLYYCKRNFKKPV